MTIPTFPARHVRRAPCVRRSPPTRQPASRPRSGAAGQPGMCCASSSIPTNSSRPIRCRSSGDPRRTRPSPAHFPSRRSARCSTRLTRDRQPARRTDWSERDLALILTGLLAGLRADELRRADVGDIRTSTGGGAVIQVRGKGGKDRTVPIEADLLAVIEDYLDSRAHRFPPTTKSSTAHGLSRWSANAPLFVGRDGERITRGTIQSRVRRAFRRAGPDAQPVHGALVHGLRHTYATELANSDVSVYTLIANEAPGSRVDGDIAAIRRRRRTRNPGRRRAKPALRIYSRSPTPIEHD
jgi:integrase